MPLSVTSIHTRLPCTPADKRMRPPSGVYLMELDTTFIMTWRIRSRSPTISGRLPGSSSSMVWPWRWASSRLA